MPLGTRNAGHNYRIRDCILENTDYEKVAEVMVDKRLYLSSYCDAIQRKLKERECFTT